jgi:hypothetical protein
MRFTPKLDKFRAARKSEEPESRLNPRVQIFSPFYRGTYALGWSGKISDCVYWNAWGLKLFIKVQIESMQNIFEIGEG